MCVCVCPAYLRSGVRAPDAQSRVSGLVRDFEWVWGFGVEQAAFGIIGLWAIGCSGFKVKCFHMLLPQVLLVGCDALDHAPQPGCQKKP